MILRLKYILIVGISLAVLKGVQAQQDVIFSQYMFNPFVVNPAYAGTRDAVSTVVLYRSQWVGMSGAPKTGSLSIHAPVKATNMSWGINVLDDRIGPTSVTGIQGTYAYRLRFLGGRLSMALRGGYFSSSYDKNTLDFDDETDRANVGGAVRSGLLNFDFGAYYYTPTFFLGLAATHLNQPSFKYSTGVAENNLHLDLRTHLILSSGFVFNISENLKFKPTAYIKYLPKVPINADVNASFLVKKRIWLGVSASTDGSLTGMVELNATDFLRLGYSYDVWLKPEIKRLSTHEVFIGYDFRFSKKTTESPKYL